MSSVTHSRRVRQIYDSLDNGNPKKAIQEADKILKKTPNAFDVKVLKAVAYIRLGKYNECFAILNEVKKLPLIDDLTVHTLSLCYRELNKPLELACILENNVKALQQQSTSSQPKENVTRLDKLLSMIYFAYVLTQDFKKLYNVAMSLYKIALANQNNHDFIASIKDENSPTDRTYLQWAAISLILQALTNDPTKAKTIFLPLANKIFVQKHMKSDNKGLSQSELDLISIILELSGDWNSALSLYTTSGNKIRYGDVTATEKIAQIYHKMGNFNMAHRSYQELIQESPDNWNYYQGFLDTLFYLPANDSLEHFSLRETSTMRNGSFRECIKSINQRHRILQILFDKRYEDQKTFLLQQCQAIEENGRMMNAFAKSICSAHEFLNEAIAYNVNPKILTYHHYNQLQHSHSNKSFNKNRVLYMARIDLCFRIFTLTTYLDNLINGHQGNFCFRNLMNPTNLCVEYLSIFSSKPCCFWDLEYYLCNEAFRSAINLEPIFDHVFKNGTISNSSVDNFHYMNYYQYFPTFDNVKQSMARATEQQEKGEPQDFMSEKQYNEFKRILTSQLLSIYTAFKMAIYVNYFNCANQNKTIYNQLLYQCIALYNDLSCQMFHIECKIKHTNAESTVSKLNKKDTPLSLTIYEFVGVNNVLYPLIAIPLHILRLRGCAYHTQEKLANSFESSADQKIDTTDFYDTIAFEMIYLSIVYAEHLTSLKSNSPLYGLYEQSKNINDSPLTKQNTGVDTIKKKKDYDKNESQQTVSAQMPLLVDQISLEPTVNSLTDKIEVDAIIKLQLLKLYYIFGAPTLCMNMFKMLGAKFIQYDTLGSYSIYPLISYGHNSTLKRCFATILRFYENAYKNLWDFSSSVVKINFLQIYDFVQFKTRLMTSHMRQMALVEMVWLDLLRVQSIPTLQELIDVTLREEELLCQDHHSTIEQQITDNTDYNIIDDFRNPTELNSDQIKETNTMYEKYWLKFRYLFLRCIIHLSQIHQKLESLLSLFPNQITGKSSLLSHGNNERNSAFCYGFNKYIMQHFDAFMSALSQIIKAKIELDSYLIQHNKMAEEKNTLSNQLRAGDDTDNIITFTKAKFLQYPYEIYRIWGPFSSNLACYVNYGGYITFRPILYSLIQSFEVLRNIATIIDAYSQNCKNDDSLNQQSPQNDIISNTIKNKNVTSTNNVRSTSQMQTLIQKLDSKMSTLKIDDSNINEVQQSSTSQIMDTIQKISDDINTYLTKENTGFLSKNITTSENSQDIRTNFSEIIKCQMDKCFEMIMNTPELVPPDSICAEQFTEHFFIQAPKFIYHNRFTIESIFFTIIIQALVTRLTQQHIVPHIITMFAENIQDTISNISGRISQIENNSFNVIEHFQTKTIPTLRDNLTQFAKICHRYATKHIQKAPEKMLQIYHKIILEDENIKNDDPKKQQYPRLLCFNNKNVSDSQTINNIYPFTTIIEDYQISINEYNQMLNNAEAFIKSLKINTANP